MTTPVGMEIVDSHVHLWDLEANASLYPELVLPLGEGPEHDVDLGGFEKLRNKSYLLDHYRSDTSEFKVTKLVHVSAVTPPGAFREESRWVDEVASVAGLPTAFIGSVDLLGPTATLESDLMAQASSERFRGVRVLFGMDPEAPVSRDLLGLLNDGQWVFDLVATTSSLPAFARLVESFPSLSVVLEHVGWPEGASAEEFARWKDVLPKLAALENVSCKISGVGMVTNTLDVDALRPWVEVCLEQFGVERCLFGSNFPIDSIYGSYDELVNSYSEITSGLSEPDRRLLFAGNAERIYRI
jgi:L-fuconolactonase